MNPWLKINPSDYVNHMSSSEVMQYQMINEYFKSVLDKYKPKKLFVPGCTIGNGFEHINWSQVEKVTALDINESYLEVLNENFGENKNLETVPIDFLKYAPKEKYDLIIAILLFEYVDLNLALQKMKQMMDQNSVLFTILQLSSENVNMISKTKYKSLEQLSSIMKLVDSEKFYSESESIGFRINSKNEITLKSGKSFLFIESSLY